MNYYFIKQEYWVRDEFCFISHCDNFLLKTNVALFDGKSADKGKIIEEIPEIHDNWLESYYVKINEEQFKMMSDIFETKEFI